MSTPNGTPGTSGSPEDRAAQEPAAVVLPPTPPEYERDQTPQPQNAADEVQSPARSGSGPAESAAPGSTSSGSAPSGATPEVAPPAAPAPSTSTTTASAPAPPATGPVASGHALHASVQQQGPGSQTGSEQATGPQAGSQHAAGPQAGSPQRPGAASPKRSNANPNKLSTFLKVSIILLSAVSVASISLLFIGDFDGKFERVFSTFALFAIFVLFTAFDTRRERKSEWYAPVALIANAYILGLLLIVIWMTPYHPFSLGWEIFWKSLLVVVVTRAVILCCEILLRLADYLPAIVTRFAFMTSVFAVLAGILFTAPVGIEAFDIHVPDLYWKIATATLILTALGLAITLLLRWYYSADVRAARKARAAVEHARNQQAAHHAQHTGPNGYPLAPQQQPHAASAQQQVPQHVPQQQAPQQGQQPLLQWPTFPDGRPLPVGPDGQPDFSALQPPRQ